MRGRKPKPTSLKLVDGNPGKGALPSPEQCLRPTRREKIPNPPSWLDSEAKKTWKALATELHRLDVLTVLDEPGLAVLCDAYADIATAKREIEALRRLRPKGLEEKVMVSQLVRQARIFKNNAARTLRSYLSEFGLSPASLAQLEKLVPPPPAGESELERIRAIVEASRSA